MCTSLFWEFHLIGKHASVGQGTRSNFNLWSLLTFTLGHQRGSCVHPFHQKQTPALRYDLTRCTFCTGRVGKGCSTVTMTQHNVTYGLRFLGKLLLFVNRQFLFICLNCHNQTLIFCIGRKGLKWFDRSKCLFEHDGD